MDSPWSLGLMVMRWKSKFRPTEEKVANGFDS